jgi:hypothetical protein
MNAAVSSTAISAVSSVSTDTFGTGWHAAIDGCHDLLAVAVGTNSMEDTFERACRQAGRKAASRPQDPRILRARRLLADDISLERAYGEIMRDRPAPKAMVDALVFSLRRGVGELTNPDAQRRLSALDADQLEAVCLRVQAFQPEISPAWYAEDVDLLISAWRKFREQR